jgi:hypothetical protein
LVQIVLFRIMQDCSARRSCRFRKQCS